MGKGGAFFAGALMGFAAGFFLAPKTGAENREDAKEFARGLMGQGQSYAKQGSERFQSSVSSFRSSGEAGGDQLQAKIDAARKIISEQVAKNAAAAKESIEEKAEEVVEAVEEKAEKVAEAVEEAVEEATE